MLRSSTRLLRTAATPLISTPSLGFTQPFMTASSSLPRPASVQALDSLELQAVNKLYRPFLETKNTPEEKDWVDDLELETVSQMASQRPEKLKILVLYGSLRTRSFSRLTAYEAARILTKLNVDVRVYDPTGLPVKDDVSDKHEKVQELRALSEWSNGQLWSCPEQHGAITGCFKNQIDWIPLSVGSVRPTQGRTLAVVQVNGGSQSFNVVNTLRLLGRWMRMFTIPNQSSIPKAWTCFTPSDRLLPSSNRDRLVDVCEELVKTTLILQPHFDLFGDRYSEREEKRQHGKLRTQQEVEEAKKKKELEEKEKKEQAEKSANTTAQILSNM
ncbi:uncharacterized protein JCM6883_007350 [Sporobolomyces salmoneus]|uniref:uncharacterized protein n=1 Tax=Sporobolomyces salmoneus TaxID=183962 RepID=UPI00316D8FD1